MWTVVDGIESSCLGKSRICSSWTKDTLSPQHSCRARKKYGTWQSKVAAAKKPWRPRPLSPAAHSTDRRMEEWAPRITCHEPRNAPESVSVPASVRAERGHCGKCQKMPHEWEVHFPDRGGGGSKKKRGGGLLLHLLQAHLHSQNKGGKTLTAKVFIYSFPPENPQQVKLLLWCVARKTSKLH